MTIQRYNFFIWPCKLLQVPASFCKIFPWIFEKFFVSLHYHNNNLNNNVQWLDLSVVANSLSSIFPGSPLCLPGASLRSGWITIRASAAFSVSLAAPTRRRRFNWFTPSWASPDLSGSFWKYSQSAILTKGSCQTTRAFFLSVSKMTGIQDAELTN